MIAICLPVWNRLSFTKMCIKSFVEYTNRDLVTKVVVYDDNSTDGTSEFCREYLPDKNIEYRRASFPGAWVGFDDLLQEVEQDPANNFIAKVDNDILFTQPWIEPIIEAFQHQEKLGSLRYGHSGSKGQVYSPIRGGNHGGLKVFRTEDTIKIRRGGRCGSTPISRNITARGGEMGIIGVGVYDLNILYPALSNKYRAAGWQR